MGRQRKYQLPLGELHKEIINGTPIEELQKIDPPIPETCGNCRHFAIIGDINRCRRFPPKGFFEDMPAVYPVVSGLGWCGEWEGK